MARKSTKAGRKARSGRLTTALRRLEQESRREPTDLRALKAALDALHTAPGDDKKKLKEKDQALVDLIAKLENDASLVLRFSRRFFVDLLSSLKAIEAILWELKGEEGPPPDPRPPQPSPSPRPPGRGEGLTL